MALSYDTWVVDIKHVAFLTRLPWHSHPSRVNSNHAFLHNTAAQCPTGTMSSFVFLRSILNRQQRDGLARYIFLTPSSPARSIAGRRSFDFPGRGVRQTPRSPKVERAAKGTPLQPSFRDNLLKLQLRDRDFRVHGASLLSPRNSRWCKSYSRPASRRRENDLLER